MDILRDNIRKVFVRYLVPSLGSAMVMSIYFLVDFIVVGRGVGADGLAAFSILTPMLALMFFFGQLLGLGGSVMYSNRVGAGKKEEGYQYFTVGMIAVLICAGVLWIVYIFFHNPILRFLGASDVTLPYAWDYMKWYTIFLPLAVTSNFWSGFVRNDGEPVRAMAGTLCGGGLNIVLDFIFVFPLHMGMQGAALASVLGLTLNVMIVVSHFFSRKNTLRLVRPTQAARRLRQIISGGISSAMVELSNAVLVFFFNIQILNYANELAVSVYGIICNWGILFLSLFNGVGIAMQPVISTNFGAGEKVRVAKTRNLAFLCVTVFGIVFSACGWLLTRPLITLFMQGTAEVFAISDPAVRIYFVAFLFMGFNIVFSYYFQSVLRLKRAFICSFSRSVFMTGCFVFLLPLAFGITGVWAAFPAGEAVTLVLSIIMGKSRKEG
ncbi:MAG: MATE family efflux transporter [Eubacterium sp.]